MTVRFSRTTKVAVLAGAALLTLSACESDTTLRILEDGGAEITIDMVDTMGLLAMSYETCDDVAADFASGADFTNDEMTVTDISEGDVLGCRIAVSSPDSTVDGEVLTETDSTFIFNVSEEYLGLTEEDVQMFQMFAGSTLSVEMPGEIVEASGDATIDGNRATFPLESLPNGILVEGNKTAAGSAAAEDGTTTDGSADDTTTDGSADAAPIADDAAEEPADNAGGLPVAAWIGIIVAILAAIGAIIFFATRKKNDDGVAQYGSSPYGQPGYGQPGYSQPTQQFGQPNQGQSPYRQPQGGGFAQPGQQGQPHYGQMQGGQTGYSTPSQQGQPHYGPTSGQGFAQPAQQGQPTYGQAQSANYSQPAQQGQPTYGQTQQYDQPTTPDQETPEANQS